MGWPLEPNFRHRVLAMVGKVVAIDLCGYEERDDPYSIVFNSILSAADLDRMSIDLLTARPPNP